MLAPVLPCPAGSQRSYLPTGRAGTERALKPPMQPGHGTHKVVIASREKRDPHSSHLHHLPSCNVTAIYVLTTPMTPGQQTCGKVAVNTGTLLARKIF